jgi:hypothetical protein
MGQFYSEIRIVSAAPCAITLSLILTVNMQDPSVSQTDGEWRQLYLAALFEADRDRLEARIAEAESALVRRGRELFRSPDNHFSEQRAIDAALSALRALRSTYQFGLSR